MPGALSGIRVIEFGVGIQGPMAATYLADMGADVIKIEPPTGAGARWNFGPADFPEGAQSPMFVAANRGKRFMQLDAHTEEARTVIYKLVETADVVVTTSVGASAPAAVASSGCMVAACCISARASSSRP